MSTERINSKMNQSDWWMTVVFRPIRIQYAWSSIDGVDEGSFRPKWQAAVVFMKCQNNRESS